MEGREEAGGTLVMAVVRALNSGSSGRDTCPPPTLGAPCPLCLCRNECLSSVPLSSVPLSERVKHKMKLNVSRGSEATDRRREEGASSRRVVGSRVRHGYGRTYSYSYLTSWLGPPKTECSSSKESCSCGRKQVLQSSKHASRGLQPPMQRLTLPT